MKKGFSLDMKKGSSLYRKASCGGMKLFFTLSGVEGLGKKVFFTLSVVEG
jgi:hypothetical protein